MITETLSNLKDIGGELLSRTKSPPGQRLLFSPEIEEMIVQDEERNGRYTAERLEAKRPEAYTAAVELLATGKVGLLKIGRLLGCHHLTIAAVRDRETERLGQLRKAVDIANERLIVGLGVAIELQVDRLLENPGLVPMTHVGMLIDQLVRNRELLAGRPTSRHEEVVTIDVHAGWDDILQTFVSEKELTADQVREIDPTIGFEPGKNLPIREGELAPDPDLAAVNAGSWRPDGKSEARTRHQKPDLATNTTSPTPIETIPTTPSTLAGDEQAAGDGSAAAERGAGGVARETRPPTDQTHPSRRNFIGNATSDPPDSPSK